MTYEKSVDISDINRAMFKCPWLEYPGRTKGRSPGDVSKSMGRVRTDPWVLPRLHTPLTAPKEELPPSPECWREHPSKPNAIPYCYSKKPEIYTHWYALYDHRKERESQKILRKMRDHPRYLKEGTLSQKLHLPMSKLTRRSPVESKPLDPAGDPLKWQRLKELTESLKSPREDEQLYAAQVRSSKVEGCGYRPGCLKKDVIQTLIKKLKGQNEGQRMDTLIALRTALNSWATVPRD
ncbi:hypothetical protein Celaphus_00000689, partial [Cervus elaphus hippelaphus]